MPGTAVILDTNFLLIPYQFKLDVLSKIELLVEPPFVFITSSAIVRELNALSRRPSRNGMAARFALKLLEANAKRIIIEETKETADLWIFKKSSETNSIVCTNDVKLRKELKKYRVPILTLKSRSKIGFE